MPRATQQSKMPPQINKPPIRTKENAPRGYLKTNSKKVLDIIAGQKKQNATQAYREVHPEANTNTAISNSYRLLKKPAAQIYLQKHVDRARNTIVELTNSDKDDIRLRASQDIMNREYGTPTGVQQTTVTVNVQPILGGLSAKQVDSEARIVEP